MYIYDLRFYCKGSCSAVCKTLLEKRFLHEPGVFNSHTCTEIPYTVYVVAVHSNVRLVRQAVYLATYAIAKSN